MKNKCYILNFFTGITLSLLTFFSAFSQSNRMQDSAGITRSLSSSTENITICNNQLPYLWNGITCLTAGTYQATLTGSNGTDSIVTLQLSVINVGTSITNIAICNNELPFTWNGNNYSAEGTYSVTLTSSSGCDSVPILSLTVNDVVTSTTNQTICSNELPFSWNGNNYPVAGTYTVTLTSAAGCDSIATLNLAINPVSSGSANISICNSQLPYHWNGNVYPSGGTYSVTLTAANGCDSVATLNLTANTTVSSTSSQAICANQLPYSWNGNSYAAAGTYSINLVASSGCDSVATLILTVAPIITSQTNRTICTGQLPYTWNGNSYAAAGNYQVTLTSSSGCDSIAKLHLVVAGVLTSTTNHSICNTQLPYTWNGNNYSASGIYTASFVTPAGCDSVATLNLNVTAPQVSTDTLIVCPEELPLNWHGHILNAGGTYSFDPPVNLSFCNAVDTLNLVVQVVIPSFTNVMVCNNELPFTWNGNTYNAAGSYAVTLTSTAGCDSVANLNLAVGSYATSTTNLSICSDQLPFLWNGSNYSGSGTYADTLVSSTGCDSIATLNLLVNQVGTSTTQLSICNAQLPFSWNGNSYSSGGTYTVTLTSSNGCDSLATLQLSVPSFLTSTTNLSICNNQLPFLWNGNAYPAAGTYTATLTTTAGCDSIATLNLVVNPVGTSITNLNICNTQLPYSWNGNIYNAGGTYNVTLIGSGGCDSIATLNLAVGTAVTSTTDLTICTNQLPYSWNGNSYPAAGSFPVTLTSSNGCDSVAILNLVVTDILTSTTNVSLCSSQLPFQWNGNDYSTPGTYSVTIHNPNGCDSVPILSLTITPYVTSTTDLTICSNQLPYSWNGNTFTQPGTYSVLLAGTGACDSLATINLSVAPQLTSTTSIAACNSAFPYTWNGNSYTVAGNYQVTLTGPGSCDSIANLVLTEIPVATSTTSISVCSNQLPYSWNGNNYITAGLYTATLLSNAGCDSIATLELFVNQTSTSSTVISICDNQLPYIWNGNNYSATGNYPVTLMGSNGCDSIATLNLTVNETASSTSIVNICDSQLPYIWNGNSYASGGIYVVTLTSANGCDSLATLDLTANSSITSTTTVNTCLSQLPYTWNGNSYAAAGTYQAMFTSSSGCDSIAILVLSVQAQLTSTTDVTICSSGFPYLWNGNSYIAAGTYQVMLTSSSGCDSIAILNLTSNSIVSSTTNISICNNQLPYTWNGNSYTASGSYTVTMISSAGCDSLATLNLSASATASSTTQVSICSNQLPYSWNGNSYSSGGSYAVTLTGSSGCDSIATLVLVANATVTSTTNMDICASQLPYSWNGNSYATAGVYTVTLTGNSGCDSIATLNLVAVSVVSSTTNINTCFSQLPYSWNGNSYSSSGTYSVTLAGSVGCDSIATLVLVANATVSGTTAVTLCNYQLPFSWNGNSYSTAGTYSVTLPGSSGCDSIAVLDLSVIAPASSITNTVTCTNQLPYTWNGNSYNAAGTYLVTLPGSMGCDSSATLNLQVNAPSASTTNTTICSTQLPYNWNGQSYTGAGSYNVSLVNAAGCDSVANLILTVNPVTTSTTNAHICASQLPYNWNGQNYSTAGIHTITLTGSGGCDSIATLYLNIHPVMASSTDAITCSNQLPYTWNGQSYDAPGDYSVMLTSVFGCDSLATLHLIVNPVVTSSTDFSICSADLPYTWNGQNYNTGGTYMATLTSAAGCDSIATLHLIVNLTPALPGILSPITYCQYDLADTLSTSITTPGSSLLWYNSATGGPGSVTAPTPATDTAGTTIFYVSQSNGFCEGPRVPITVTVNSKPGLGPDKDLRICFGRSADLSNIINVSGLQATWTFGQSVVTDLSNVSIGGAYQLVAMNSAGCADTAVVNLGIQPQVVADAGGDADAEYNMPYQLSGSGNGHYQWSPTNLVTDPFIANPLATLSNDASFVLMVIDDIGCFALDTVKLRVLKGPTFYVPSAFTPNNDGLNDIFRPTPVGIASLEYFRVFNRFGELVYETQEISKGWNGTYKGNKQPIGNYVWSLKGTDRTGKVKMMKGNVVLIR